MQFSFRHIGARQDNYNSVLMLLARGADVDLMNKLGETALECVPQLGDCYNAIALNVHLLAVKDAPRKSQKVVLTKYDCFPPFLSIVSTFLICFQRYFER